MSATTHEQCKAFEDGFNSGKAVGQLLMAEEMLVLFCALITAHKVAPVAFWPTVEIVKKTLASYAGFDDDDWAMFRKDYVSKRKAP